MKANTMAALPVCPMPGCGRVLLPSVRCELVDSHGENRIYVCRRHMPPRICCASQRLEEAGAHNVLMALAASGRIVLDREPYRPARWVRWRRQTEQVEPRVVLLWFVCAAVFWSAVAVIVRWWKG